MLPPEDATGLRAKYSVIYDEEEKAREEAWYIYLSQHAHDFSGSQGQTGLVSLAQLGIEIVISMVQSGHSDRDYLELLVQAGCPVSACKGGSMGESRWLQGASHWLEWGRLYPATLIPHMPPPFCAFLAFSPVPCSCMLTRAEC